MDPSGPNIRVGMDRRVAPLFIKATGVSLVDSQDSKQIQVADILAGATSYLICSAALLKVQPVVSSTKILRSPFDMISSPCLDLFGLHLK